MRNTLSETRKGAFVRTNHFEDNNRLKCLKEAMARKKAQMEAKFIEISYGSSITIAEYLGLPPSSDYEETGDEEAAVAEDGEIEVQAFRKNEIPCGFLNQFEMIECDCSLDPCFCLDPRLFGIQIEYEA